MFKKCKTLENIPEIKMVLSSKILSTAVVMSIFIGLTACERLPYADTDIVNANIVDINRDAYSQTNDGKVMAEISQVIDAKLPKPSSIIDCQNLASEKAGQNIKIKGHSVLSEGCDLTNKSVRFVLNSSHSSLDCRGARLSTMTNDHSNASAIMIKPDTDAAIRDIAVANCHVDGYGHALHIRQYSNPNQRYARGFTDPAANRNLAPQDIRITNVSSINSINSGMFVGDHVHAVTFDQVQIQNAGTVGLYLEFGSRDNVIKNSVFIGNGFRTFKPNREAIAVDSSANNRIEHNLFIHNGAGSITLYRNCFEHADDPTQSNHFKRTESSRDNIISDNTFRNESVGVWIASRQSRNLKGFQCGAYLIKKTLLASYHLDSAKDNLISNNYFEQVEQGIIVEDDGTQINSNQFATTVNMPISVGSKIREDSEAGAVINTVIKDNTFTGKTIEQAITIRDASKTATEIR